MLMRGMMPKARRAAVPYASFRENAATTKTRLAVKTAYA